MSTYLLVTPVALCVALLSAQFAALKLGRNWETRTMKDVGASITAYKPGLPSYRILNKIGHDIYIGGNETLLKLSVVDNEVLKTKIQLETAEPILTVTCELQNPLNNQTVCWNFIRVAEMTSSGELFACGTNAFTPLCYKCPADLSTKCTAINGSTLTLVPKFPHTNPSTMLLDDELYAGSVSEDTFQRYNVSDLRTNDPVKLELETVTAGEGFIKDPTFVGKPYEYTSNDGNEYVFVFYRETALEYDNHGVKEYSRIARVCKNDTGGRVDTTKFVTFIKARLNCSIPDELFPYYFDDIQDVVWDGSVNEAYAVFTSQDHVLFDGQHPIYMDIRGTRASSIVQYKYTYSIFALAFTDFGPSLAPAASALCRFRMEDIMKLFDEGDSKQQEESNSLWLPKRVGNPRPGTCTANYDTIDYPPLLDKLVPNYNPYEPPPGEQQEPPPANFNASSIPTLYVDGVRFTSLAVDFDYGCLYFFGTSTGSVIKAHKKDCSDISEPYTSIEIEELETNGPITDLELLTDDSIEYLVITTEHTVVTWPLNTNCSAQTEQECTTIRYPYCSSNGSECVCANAYSGCQDEAYSCTSTGLPRYSIEVSEPFVSSTCVNADSIPDSVPWTDVTALQCWNNNASLGSEFAVSCADSGDVLFGVGSHTVTCIVSGPCWSQRPLVISSFVFNVKDCADSPELLFNCSRLNIDEFLVCLSKVRLTPENAAIIAHHVAVATKNVTSLTLRSILAVSDFLENLVALNHPSNEVARYIIVIGNNVLEVDQAVFDEHDEDAFTSRIILSLESYISALQLQGAGNFTEVQANIAVQTFALPLSSLQTNLWFATLLDTTTPDELTDNDIVSRLIPDTSLETDVSIFLPAEVFKRGLKGNTVNISFFVYQNSKLFRSSKLLSANDSPVEFKRVVGSRIVSATVEGVRIDNLTSPIVTDFHLTNITSASSSEDGYLCGPECVFWDFTLNGGYGDWSSKGCWKQTDSKQRVTCHCDHLTSFAVLVDIYGRSSVVLDVISKIGCSFSIVGLLITLGTHLAIRKLRSKQPKQILISLCFALLGLYLIFLVGIEAPPCTLGCSIVAGLIHYFTLAAVAWMAVEATNLYLLLVRVMNADVAHFMIKASFAAWGLPLVVVVVIIAADYTQYTDNRHCFLKPGSAFYYGQLLPIALVLVFNFVVFILIMRKLTYARKSVGRHSSKDRSQEMIRRLQNAFAISVLLGLAWILGLLAAIEESTFVFQFLFAICNSLQGLLIFVLFCARQKEIRQEWWNLLRRCSQKGDAGGTRQLPRSTNTADVPPPKPATESGVAMESHSL